VEFATTAEETAFRQEVRSWLGENVPKTPRPPITLEGHEQAAFMKAWQKKLFDAGWAGISWPKAYGGRGRSPQEQVIWYEEYARVKAPDASCLFVGLNHGGPTLIVEGSEEQKAFHLPKILSGEVLWCQGFSEPGAGSDLANIRTRGRVEGDELVVNGQKIWTSFAQVADYQELLVRTEEGSQRGRGLTWIICDMKLPGITVRPIESLDHEHHNCEVFYDEVRIPLANVVGGLGNGWKVAMATLSFERGTAFMESQLRLSVTLDRLIAKARTTTGPDGRPAIEDGHYAARLGELRAQVAALRAMTYMGASRNLRQALPGPEGTFVALRLAELKQEVMRLGMEIFGHEGLAEHDFLIPEEWVHQYLYSYAATIGGGTSEVRRNIIAERVLGLPRHS
jgi:alkylation response protein AidB-like acyl-CoA dehydrogenase